MRRSTCRGCRERIIVAGGGYIAIEFAGIFSHLGVETTLVYRGDKILRGFDEDLRDRLTEAYIKAGHPHRHRAHLHPHREDGATASSATSRTAAR